MRCSKYACRPYPPSRQATRALQVPHASLSQFQKALRCLARSTSFKHLHGSFLGQLGLHERFSFDLECAGDLTAATASCAASPAISRSSALTIPRLHLSPAPSASAADFGAVPPLRLSPAPSGSLKVPPLHLSPAPSGNIKMPPLCLSPAPSGNIAVPPLRLSPAPSGNFTYGGAGLMGGLPGAAGGAPANVSRIGQASKAAVQLGGPAIQPQAAPWKVPALKLAGQVKGEALIL